jgi:trehalose 6-phosphate synthase
MPQMERPAIGQHDEVWSADRLGKWVATFHEGESIVVLANREPVRHERSMDGRIIARRPASGLLTALEPLLQACSGIWVAHGVGSADRLVVDERDGLAVPPGNPRYRLRRVWLDEREERGYYHGFANEALWPLCHRAFVQPTFRLDDFRMYSAINRRFAEAVCQEVDSDAPLILVQDYHFAIAPQIIRDHLPHSTIVAFWHIPWPNPADYAICPWGRPLLEGLLASSIVGFQTEGDCRNFADTVERSLDVSVNRARDVITYAGRRTIVRSYPVSVEWRRPAACQLAPIGTCREEVRRQLDLAANVRLVVGVDRLDYTKGIVEKFLAVERLLELHASLRGRLVFVQVAEPSRVQLAAYRDLRSRLIDTTCRINRRFGGAGVSPLRLLEAHHEPAEVDRLLRAADVCYVGSLHDGMNLVAKEFVRARDDERGVLILSGFTGAARELTDALLVNPYAIDDTAHALARALSMSAEEQSSRMRALRSIVAEFNAYRWAADILADAGRLRARPAKSREARRAARTACLNEQSGPPR